MFEYLFVYELHHFELAEGDSYYNQMCNLTGSCNGTFITRIEHQTKYYE